MIQLTQIYHNIFHGKYDDYNLWIEYHGMNRVILKITMVLMVTKPW